MKTSSTDDIRLASFDRPLGTGSGRTLGPDLAQDRTDPAVVRGRAQGRAEGFATGWAQGRQAAAELERAEAAVRAEQDLQRRQADAARLATAIDQLTDAARRLDRSTAPAWCDLADVICDGALAIARAALGRELATVDQPVMDAVRTALRTLADPAEVVVRLHPTDHQQVERLAGQAVDAVARPGLRMVPDPEVEPGDVLALTPEQRLRLSLPAALAAAEEVLRG